MYEVVKSINLLYNTTMNNKKRYVKRSKSSDMKYLSNSGYTKSQKVKIRSSQRASRLAMTKARKYLLYAVGCFVSIQVIKFIMYSLIYTGDTSPSGIIFLFVIWLQTGLLLATFIFFVLSIFKTLSRLVTE